MKRIFRSIQNFFRKIYGNIFDLAKNRGYIAIKVVEELKKLVENPGADLVVTLIPGEIDNVILIKLRQILPEVLFKLSVGLKIIEGSKTQPAPVLIMQIVEYLRALDKEDRGILYRELQARLTEALIDGKLSIDEVIIAARLAWIEYKRGMQP